MGGGWGKRTGVGEWGKRVVRCGGRGEAAAAAMTPTLGKGSLLPHHSRTRFEEGLFPLVKWEPGAYVKNE